MNLVILTEKRSGWPRPLWIEISIDSKYIHKIKETSRKVIESGAGNSILKAIGAWQSRREFINYRLEAVCGKDDVKFRLINIESDSKIYSDGILIVTLDRLNQVSNPEQRVFFSNDRTVLMAIYHSTKNAKNS